MSKLPPSVQEHEARAAGRVVRCAVLTVSDTRTRENDASGDAIAKLLTDAGHEVVDREIVPDEPVRVAAVLDRWLPKQEIDCVITTGGTGISRRDQTVGVIRERLRTELPGFGETFRRLSFDEIGPPAMLSRALAGTTNPPHPSGLFALPGSRAAVELACGCLIIPLLPHLLDQLRS